MLNLPASSPGPSNKTFPGAIWKTIEIGDLVYRYELK